MKGYEFLTSCKLCGESVKIPQEEYLLADDNIGSAGDYSVDESFEE